MALPADVDPRSPVIVGVAQVLGTPGDSPEPVALMAEAARSAQTDSGATGLLGAVDTLAVVPVMSWRYHDPAALLAVELGASPRERWYPAMGGNAPQLVVNRAAAAIAAGGSDVALVCGGEAFRTRQAQRRAGVRPDWTVQSEHDRPTWGDAQTLAMGHPDELAHGIFLPTQCYPLFENAIRHRAGRTAAEHTAAISELWAGFSRVAADNPYAIDRTAHSAAEIATVTSDNRMIGFPYTKHMVANPDVDAATAIIVCSAEHAESIGVDRERWVFLWSGADAVDPTMSERPDFTSSAAIGLAGRSALELAGVGVDDLAHIDVYSCFPSAVELACAELGIGLDRALTVYGGLCFAGGPWNNPVSHAIAAMVTRLRESAGAVGLVTANGGIIEKHAFGVYGAGPPSAPYRSSHPQFAIDSSTTRHRLDPDHAGPVTVETWTVMHGRDGEMTRAHAAVLTPDGARAWGTTHDVEVMARMESEDFGGVPALRAADGDLTF